MTLTKKMHLSVFREVLLIIVDLYLYLIYKLHFSRYVPINVK